jgi:uncharacterized protein YecT (DUF1311 family)
MIEPVDSPSETESQREPEAAAPLLAGAIRLPRSRLMAIGVVGAVVVIAGIGVLSGVSRSRRSDLDSGDGIRIGTTSAQRIPQATPIQQVIGAEPGAEPIGAPVETRSDNAPVLLDQPSTPDLEAARDRHGAPDEGAVAGSSSPSSPETPETAPDSRFSSPPNVPSSAAGHDDDAPSFACAAPRTRIQALICSDAHLAAADRRVRVAYRRAMVESADPEALAASQARWRAARDVAAEHQDAGALADLYASRLRELEPR